MLRELSINNFALIKEINIEFKDNLNIIMGETGSGKSSIIDALSILLGDRASKDKIRQDSDSSFLSAAFEISNNDDAIELLKSQNLYNDDEYLVISREIYRKSSSVSRVNNRIVSLNFIKELSKTLIDIYGQFENITILSSSEQRSFLDKLGDDNHLELLDKYRKKYIEYTKLLDEYKNFLNSPEEVNRNIEFLEFQIKEIEESNVLNINEEDLENRLKILENISNLKQNSIELLNILDDNSGVISSLSKIVSLSEDIVKIDDDFKMAHDRLNSVLIEILDIKSDIKNYSDSLEFDDEDYSILDNKRKTLFDIKRKYGNSLSEVEDFLKNSKSRLNEILNYEKILEEKKQNLRDEKDILSNLATQISNSRKNISKIFIKNILKELDDLEIKNAKFDIEFIETGLTINGIDSINFLISFNKNETLKLFSEVASGGEISRFMLAVKTITADKEKTPILIFDEIDSGISGNAGNVVGKKLKKLSKNHQLIVISHLPQIISKADAQFLVYKLEKNNITKSIIENLDYNRRIEEIAKVIEGDNYSESTYLTAKNMIDESI